MKKFLVILVIVLGLLFAVVYYISIPYTIPSKGIILPSLEWRLDKTSDGNIVNMVRDNMANSVLSYSFVEFQRGDHAEFRVNRDLIQSDSICMGDTVGIISSHQENLNLLELQGDLENQKKLLLLYSTGSKVEQIEIALERISLAEQEYDAQTRLMTRTEALHKQGIISDDEFDRAQRDYIVKKQNVNIAKATYQELLTGSKPEQLELVRASIRSLQAQIQQVEKRLSSFCITAPFSGQIVKIKGNGSDVYPIIRVASTDNVIAVLPVELYQLPYISIGQRVSLRSGFWREDMEGTIQKIDSYVQQQRQRQIIYITVVIDDFNKPLMSNMMVDAEVHCGDISVIRYLRRMFRTVYEN